MPDGRALKSNRSSTILSCVSLAPLPGIDVLPKHDGHVVDITETKLPNPVRLIGWLHCHDRTATDYFPVIRVDVLDPLKQVDAAWVATVSHEVMAELSRHTTAYVSSQKSHENPKTSAVLTQAGPPINQQGI